MTDEDIETQTGERGVSSRKGMDASGKKKERKKWLTTPGMPTETEGQGRTRGPTRTDEELTETPENDRTQKKSGEKRSQRSNKGKGGKAKRKCKAEKKKRIFPRPPKGREMRKRP